MSSLRKALVLGANGQDGSYLCESLCARGYAVTGVGRQPTPRWPVAGSNFIYRACDVADMKALSGLLRDIRPDIIFHFAAVHGPSDFDYEAVWEKAHLVNTLSVHAVLNHIHRENPGCGLVYASSSKVFGNPTSAVLDEDCPRLSTCIYSTTKNAAHGLIDYYRGRYGVAASALYLFNHESPRRGAAFFIPRVAAALAAARAGTGVKTRLHTLDFAADWGDAREYMELSVDVAERALGKDYVMATGTTWNARQMAESAFRRHGLDYAAHIETTVSGPAAPSTQAMNRRLLQAIGRIPSRSVLDIVEELASHRTAA